MKTADLIPLILLELNEGDKYGYELTKAIEDKSNGKIVIKQPTLYTVLKKLEKSKFISSYWQDSEIGGKRHYYGITDNGKMQISTLPSYETLVNYITSEEDVDASTLSVADTQNDNNTVIENNVVENVIPSEEVFANNSIDNATELEINIANAAVVKEEKQSHEEIFAENETVSSFVSEQSSKITDEYKNQFNNKSTNSLINLDYEPKSLEKNEIKYVDYKDYSKDPANIYAKKATKNLIYRSLSTSLYLLLMIVICSLVSNLVGYSLMFLISLIACSIVMVFYPIVIISRNKEIKMSLIDKEYTPNYKKHILILAIAEIIFVLVCLVVNIATKQSLLLALSISSFSSFYAPILFSTGAFMDLLFKYLFNKNLK